MGKQDINSEDHKLKSVYRFIVGYFKKYGFAPSFREISLGTDIKSTSTIREKLLILERDELVSLNEFQPRTIKLMGYKYIKRGISREDTRKSNQSVWRELSAAGRNPCRDLLHIQKIEETVFINC